MNKLFEINNYFRPASDWTKEYFGKRIQKIPVDGGFSCPNRDGRYSSTGCIYCNNNSFSPFYTHDKKTITEQLEIGIDYFSKRYNCSDFFVYFQTYSGTYAPIDVLEKKYNEALKFSNIKGLIIATRPDCIDDSVIKLLLKIKNKTYIRVEIGVESFDDNVLKAINRCHDSKTAIDAINLLRKNEIDTSVHLIFGLPNESDNSAKEYGNILSDTGAEFVKLHHLQIVKGSRLEEIFNNNPDFVKLHSLDSYIVKIAEFLSYLAPEIYVERFINRVPPKMLIAPKFGDIDENRFSQMLCDYMLEHHLSQGCLRK